MPKAEKPPKPPLTPHSGPAERFRYDDRDVLQFRQLTDTQVFNKGAEAAFAQYCVELADYATDLNTAAAVGFRLRGASEILAMIKTLCEPPKAKPEMPSFGTLKPTDQPKRY